ncbi:MAG: polysaccharide deacetylase family protein [Cyclobacteriaceae bacterium]|nr:polysaccharide deacetylase family protein [Cyclobacteriaceae bacterium]
MRLSVVALLLVFFGCATDSKKETVEEQTLAANSSALNEKYEVVCFVYHRFGDSRYPSTNVSTKDFESHLSWLKANNYRVVTLSQALENQAGGSAHVRTAVITIDDGYKSFFENALPLLKKFGFQATLFINTETVGSDDYMDWSELERATAAGVEIGNHTHSHSYFLNIDETNRYATFEGEIKNSQQLIEKELGHKPKVFAYPYGEFDPEMKMIVKALGFKSAAAQNSGVINATTDLFELPRFPMSENYADMFEEKAKMHAMSVTAKQPESHMLPRKNSRPTLSLVIKKQKLITDQFNCFIQGSKCKLKVTPESDSTVRVTVQSESSIARARRTLYTITAPDNSGEWYWYSHLWINPAVSESCTKSNFRPSRYHYVTDSLWIRQNGK